MAFPGLPKTWARRQEAEIDDSFQKSLIYTCQGLFTARGTWKEPKQLHTTALEILLLTDPAVSHASESPCDLILYCLAVYN